MRKNYLLLALLASTFSFAQFVGVNTENPASTLDIVAKDAALATQSQIDGVLVPRVSAERAEAMGTTVPNANLIFINDITAPATVNTTSLVTAAGFYYFDEAQTKWIPLSFAGNDWHLAGNSGTTVGTDFLGTTDDEPLQFRTNNIQAGYLSTDTEGNKNLSIGHGAFPNASVTPSSSNNAFGNGALGAFVEGQNNVALGGNVAFGNGALGSAVTAAFSTAVGVDAMGGSTASWNNVAVGISTLYHNVGSNNTAVGGSALGNSTTASGNVAMGLGSMGGNNTGSGNVTLGLGTGQAIVHGSSNILIGTQVNVPSDRSRFLNIGNLITGTGITGWGVYSSPQANMNEFPNKRIGIALPAPGYLPNSTLHVGGSFAAPLIVVNSGNLTLTESHYAVRIYGGASGVTLPAASTCPGRVYVIIGSNGISNKTISANGSEVYDDVANRHYQETGINGGERIQVQSDGTNWIVIGN